MQTKNLEAHWQNFDQDRIGEEYPRMMYRKTDIEDRVQQTEKNSSVSKQDTWLVQNLYDGYLCDTRVAADADEAEALTAEGWDISPKAAHGVVGGLAAVTTAKDERIAELEARLAALDAAPADPVMPELKRGPGRPPRSANTFTE